MEGRETARMRKYGESKTTRIMMATVPHVTSGLGLRKFQADGFMLTRVYNNKYYLSRPQMVVGGQLKRPIALSSGYNVSHINHHEGECEN